MNQAELLSQVVRHLESLGLVYMVVGSLASSRYGEPRFTRDIDLVVDLTSEMVERFCAPFEGDEFYCSRSAIEDAVKRRQPFNVIHTLSGEKLDFMPVRSDAWGKEQLARRRRMIVLDPVEAYVAGPEDVILAKMWYFDIGHSDRHLRDIASMCKVGPIDKAYVSHWAQQLGYEEIWRSIQNRLSSPDPPPPAIP